jgi:hypothetical protein
MDRDRFRQLLEAYGADTRRWPAEERAPAAAFRLQHGVELKTEIDEARRLDETLDSASEQLGSLDTLSARILAQAPRQREASFDRRALWALAACAVFGLVAGYGGGRLAPPSQDYALEDDVEAYLALAFEAPFETPGDEG